MLADALWVVFIAFSQLLLPSGLLLTHSWDTLTSPKHHSHNTMCYILLLTPHRKNKWVLHCIKIQSNRQTWLLDSPLLIQCLGIPAACHRPTHLPQGISSSMPLNSHGALLPKSFFIYPFTRFRPAPPDSFSFLAGELSYLQFFSSMPKSPFRHYLQRFLK